MRIISLLSRGFVIWVAMATLACASGGKGGDSELQKRAEGWASYISRNDWLKAYTTFAPVLIEACGTQDLVDFQSHFLQNKPKSLVDVSVAKVETMGEVGYVHLKLKGYESFQNPDRWLLRDGQWWYSPDYPNTRCVRQYPQDTSVNLRIPREEFLSQFRREVSRIHPLTSPSDKGPLLNFALVSETYELNPYSGEYLYSIMEQRLPRMQPVVTYEVPARRLPDSMVQASTRLTMYGEKHALTQVVLQAYQDYSSPDPWLQARQFTYFAALGEVLAPNWSRQFSFGNWFTGQAGEEADYSQDAMRIRLKYWKRCEPKTNVLCPPRHLRWLATFHVDTPSPPTFPLPDCKERPDAYYIVTGKTC